MASPERLYHGSVRVFSAIFVLLGIAILISTLARGGGPLSLGVVLGIAFLVVGIVRGWLGGGGPPWRRTKSEHMGEAAETGPAAERPRE
ncbi:MAG TPA: hypothetical protein VFU04_00500 [Solirubrobacterales bacterium]|nr:hypothetical protein [Solirubrobacterales bacterium]